MQCPGLSNPSEVYTAAVAMERWLMQTDAEKKRETEKGSAVIWMQNCCLEKIEISVTHLLAHLLVRAHIYSCYFYS